MRILRIKLIVIVLAIFLFLCFLFYVLAISKYGIFSKIVGRMGGGELDQNKTYEQYPNLEVKTIQTPQQTYDKLRNYLETEQLEQALSLFSDKYRDEYKNIFEQAKLVGKLNELSDRLEKKISKDEKNCYPARCSYLMDKSKTPIDFVKDSQGIWLIEAL